MSTHRYHPSISENGLADNCERCTEHAHHPFISLDNNNLALLVKRVKDDLDPRSENEGIAMAVVSNAKRDADKLARTW